MSKEFGSTGLIAPATRQCLGTAAGNTPLDSTHFAEVTTAPLVGSPICVERDAQGSQICASGRGYFWQGGATSARDIEAFIVNAKDVASDSKLAPLINRPTRSELVELITSRLIEQLDCS